MSVFFTRFQPYDGSRTHEKIKALRDAGKFQDLHMLIWRWQHRTSAYDPVRDLARHKYISHAKWLSSDETFKSQATLADPTVKMVVELNIPVMAYYVDGQLWKRINHVDLEEKKARASGVVRWRKGEAVEWLIGYPTTGLEAKIKEAEEALRQKAKTL